MDRLDRARSIALQQRDLARDLVGGLLGLDRQRFDLGRHHREAAAGLAGPGRLDRRIQGQKIGLAGNGGDQIDDIADLGRGRAQAVDALGGSGGRVGGALGQAVGILHAIADFTRGAGQLFRGLGELRGILPGFLRFGRQGLGPAANAVQRIDRGLGADPDAVGGAGDATDHGDQILLEQIDGFADGRQFGPGRRRIWHQRRATGCETGRGRRHADGLAFWR